MATTSGIQVTDKAINGRRGNGNGRRYGLKAKLAAGAVALGCAAALAFGGLRASDSVRAAGAAPAASFSQVGGVERQRFLDWNTQLPDGTLPIVLVSAEAQRFLDWNTQLPDGGLVAPASSDRSAYR